MSSSRVPIRYVASSLALCALVTAQSVWNPLVDASPAGRSDHAAAFDPGRDRLVVFGGSGQYNTRAYDDSTWEWNGALWDRRPTAVAPSPRTGAAMVYDPTHGRMLLFGGRSRAGTESDTWAWDGTSWTQLQPPTMPPDRTRHTMVWDAARQRVVMFGGARLSQNSFASLADTWEFDGVTWTEATPALSPPARTIHTSTYDAARGTTLVYGGTLGSTLLTDLWSWDGVAWTNLGAPPFATMAGARIVYDEARQRTVLYGGAYGPNSETWEFDGTAWQRVATPGLPGLRWSHAMVYDPIRTRVLLVGGGESFAWDTTASIVEFDGAQWRYAAPNRQNLPTAEVQVVFDGTTQRPISFGGPLMFGAISGETYTFDGSVWVAMQNATRPPARTRHSMAFDRGRQRVVMFGGSAGGLDLGDTWEWDGMDWQQRVTVGGPAPRRYAAMAYDEARGRTVLLGGVAGLLVAPLAETWEWDGQSWSSIATANVPNGLRAATMVYDMLRQRIVLFGGASSVALTLTNETWEYDGVDWTKRLPVTVPPGRTNQSMAYDPVRGRVIMHGGRSATYQELDDTWEWDGSNWTEVTSEPKPVDARLVFDEAGPRTLGFVDGYETWEFRTTNAPLLQVAGGGCGGGMLRAAPLAYPVIGRPFSLVVEGNAPGATALVMIGASEFAYRGIPLPLALDTIGMTGCELVQSANYLEATIADAGGIATVSINVPGLPSLLGQRYHAQAVIAEPNRNPMGWTTTDGLTVRIGN